MFSKISKLLFVVFLLISSSSGFLPFGMNLVGFHLPQFSLLLSCLKDLACSHIVLVGVDLEQVLPLVKHHLVQGVASVQGGQGLHPLAIACWIVLQERPGIDVIGCRPEAWPLVTVTLPVHWRLPVPATTRFRPFRALNYCLQLKRYLTCAMSTSGHAH